MKNEYNEGDLITLSIRGRMALAHYSHLPKVGVITKSRKQCASSFTVEVTWMDSSFRKTRMHIDFVEPLDIRTKNVLDF